MKIILLMNIAPHIPVRLAEFPFEPGNLGCSADVLWIEVEKAVKRTFRDLKRLNDGTLVTPVRLQCRNCQACESIHAHFGADGSRSYRCFQCGNAWTIRTPDVETN